MCLSSPPTIVALVVALHAPWLASCFRQSGTELDGQLASGSNNKHNSTQELAIDSSEGHNSIPTKWGHWLGNDYIQINASAAEAKLREASPGILRNDEKVIMAFKVGRNKNYFTNARILLRPKSSLSSKRVTYQSIRYEQIKAFKFKTAGKWPDMETDLTLYTNLPTFAKVHMGFRKGTRAEKVKIYDIGRFFAKLVLGLNVPRPPMEGSLLQSSTDASIGNHEQWIGDAVAWLGGDASQINAQEVEMDLRKNVALLGSTERVHMAFKIGRDITLMTSRRIIRIDVQGLSGKRIEYMTIPYEVIKAFVLQTAGHFDLDAEMRIWTDLPAYRDFKQDLRAGKADIKGIQALLSDKVLGVRSTAGWSLVETEDSGPMDLFHWLGNNFHQVDPREAEQYVRSHRVLQAVGEEQVLMAFRVGRDMNLLTNKRLLMIDVKKFGKKVEFKTIPYHAVRAYAVKTAGYFDGDAELMIWTGIMPPPPLPQGEDQPPPPPPCPSVGGWDDCLSYVEFDLRRGRTDINGIQQLLSAYVLGFQPYPVGSYSFMQSTINQTNPFTDFFHYLGNNAEQVDPRQVEYQFKNAHILQHDEVVQLAFRIGGDFHIWSSKRFLLVDRKGFMDSGRKVLYQSIPYFSMKAFAVTSAGMWDTDSELEFWTDMPWLSHYEQDLRRGRVNLREIMMKIAAILLKDHVAPGYSLQETGDISHFWGNAYEIDAQEAEREFKTDKPILLPDEVVSFACQDGRDKTLLTTKRIVRVDVKGFTGKRVNYRSIPYSNVGSFLVRSAGALDSDTEMEVFTTSHGYSHFKQDFKKKKVDIFKVSRILTDVVK